MADGPPPTTATATNAPGIRRAAVVMAVAVGIANALRLWLFWGQPLSGTVRSGLFAAGVGWICWYAYHRISRRHDGLISGVFGGLIFDKGITPLSYPSLIGGLVWAAMIGGFLGIVRRGISAISPTDPPPAESVDSAEGEEVIRPVPPISRP